MSVKEKLFRVFLCFAKDILFPVSKFFEKLSYSNNRVLRQGNNKTMRFAKMLIHSGFTSMVVSLGGVLCEGRLYGPQSFICIKVEWSGFYTLKNCIHYVLGYTLSNIFDSLSSPISLWNRQRQNSFCLVCLYLCTFQTVFLVILCFLCSNSLCVYKW